MSRKVPVQLAHVGVKNGWKRKGHGIVDSNGNGVVICTTDRVTFYPDKEKLPAGSPSISQAKHYMRTGAYK